MIRRISPCLALVATLASPAVLAHGDAHAHGAHASKPAAGKPATTAFGRVGDSAKVSRTVTIEMSDQMRFSPDTLTVRRGQTLRLVVVNKGKLPHELVLGTPQEIQKHWEDMKRHPHMHHDEPHMVHVQPGKRGELIWQFTQAGEFQFACLLPGHFEAGMVGKVVVQ